MKSVVPMMLEPSSSGGFPWGKKGFALLVVIVVLLLASFLASQLTLDVRTEYRIALHAQERNRAALLAESGINIALFRLLDRPVDLTAEEEFGAMVAGREYRHRLNGGQVVYHAANESGKIDLNSADPQLLALFLRYQGLTMEQAAVIGDSLQDWRDNDTMARLNGAEQEYYMHLPEPYQPRNGAMEDPSEFFLLRGTAPLAGRFAAGEVFTIHNSAKKINVNSLTPAMLDFLVNGDQARREAYLAARQGLPALNAAATQQILGPERFAELEPFLAYEDGAASLYYTITATGLPGAGEGRQASSPAGLTVQALVRLLANGYQILAWQEYYS
ncbi:MAG: general secretion pathway protein GspK [Thermodesulfobacteriota bacterium]